MDRPRLAFTLTEFIVVAVIITLLAGSVTVSVRNYRFRRNERSAMADMARIATALRSYYNFNGSYPTSNEGLRVLASDDYGENADAWLAEVPIDPWGNRYQYRRPAIDRCEVICFGADGREGGAGVNADIVSQP